MSATRAAFNTLVAAQQGVPYVFGGTSLKGAPSPGLDCSGLPFAVADALGTPIPRTSEEQFAALAVIDPADVVQGDLVFYNVPEDTQPQPAHEAVVWVPGGTVIQAPHTGDVVRVSPLGLYPIMGYRRVPFAGEPAPGPTPPPPTPPDNLGVDEMAAWQENGQNHVVWYFEGKGVHSWQAIGGNPPGTPPWESEWLPTPA